MKLIHIAHVYLKNEGHAYLFLRKMDPYRYMWFQQNHLGAEVETSVWGGTVEETILAAYKEWKYQSIRMVHCGYRYTLPERDEVGTNALFHQMAASYSSMSGIYFDEDLEFNCIVQNASSEARELLKRIGSI